MSRDFSRKDFYNRDRDRDRDWNRNDLNFEKNRPLPRKRSRSPPRDLDKRRSRSPRKSDKDLLDENILSEISKLPEPSELWDNQMQESGFAPAPPAPAFSTDGSTYAANYQPSYPGIYDDFPTLSTMPVQLQPQQTHSADMSAWNQMSLPPPPAPPTIYNVEDQIKKEAAIETEMRHQKAALSKQREDYIKKAGILKKELDTLKDQRNELRGDPKRSPSPDTKRFLKENTKLQLEIQNKLKTINNVVDMLNGIIGEEAQDLHESDETTERSSKRKSRSPTGKKFNYVYYDPEMHWCRVCNEFPSTAKDYLNHLHSMAHHKMATQHMEAPWHSVTGMNEGFPSYPSAPTKRTPIRGLQFFVPSTAWYCKLCDQFIGDLHCASAHLKSVTHSKNYTNFVEQNPHWETDWMSDRQKAFEKARATNKAKVEEKPQYAAHTITFNKDGFHTKRKLESPPPPAETKKKKDKKKKNKKRKEQRSSSSSSSSSSTGSDSEPKKKKKSKKRKSSDKLTEWMSSIQMGRLNESDRKLLDNIKHRIKQDKESDKRRTPERARERSVIDLRSPRERDRDRDRDSRPSRVRDDSDRRDDSRRRDDRRDEHRDERRDERREERREERRDERWDERRDERRDDSRSSQRRSPPRADAKKPDIRKMPFIGKMPVYKNLVKNTKTDETKKEEEKKKEDDEASKKRREEIDAEIQKKVAEFKAKIAKAQLEREQADLPPPMLLQLPPHAFLPPAPTPPALPPALPPAQPPPPATQPPPNLPKDFQDALDIIFPSDVKKELGQQDLFSGIPGFGGPGFPGIPGLGGVMNPFPQLSILGQPPPHLMMGFDMNAPLFGHRPQLYDTHVPIVPSPKHRQNKNRQNKPNGPNKKAQTQTIQNNTCKTTNNNNAGDNPAATSTSSAPGTAAAATTVTPSVPPEPSATATVTDTAAPPACKKKEELDDLAMLGIDATDVGAGM